MYRIYKSGDHMYKLYTEEAITLIKEALVQEQTYVKIYEEMDKILEASSEKDTIAKILNDEKEHVQTFRWLLLELTSKNTAPVEITVQPVPNCILGIRACIEAKIASVDKYNKIYHNLQENKYKNIIIKLINDEFKHLNQLNYLLIEKCLTNLK
jgi:rubrerythrin